MLSIHDAMDALEAKLIAYFDARSYQWKSSERPDVFEASKPTIYKYCVPPSDINNHQMPSRCPAILLALTKWKRSDPGKVELNLAINCVAVHATTTDTETAYSNGDGSYHLGTGDDYAQDALSLYKSALLLAECVVDAVSLMSYTAESPISIMAHEFEPPDALLQDYPYAVCVVPVTVMMIDNGAKDLSYHNLL